MEAKLFQRKDYFKITAKETLDNNLIKSTKAYKNKKIINLNLENWYLASGGLTVTENIIKELKLQ